MAASASFLLYAARGYVDAPFLALVVWAGVLEVERERRAAARRARDAARRSPGLLRPEAWVLAGLYWLWALRAPARPRAAIAARRACSSAPLLWALADLAVTGDPLHSLHATSELADDLGRERGLGAVPGRVRVVRRRDRAPAGRAARAVGAVAGACAARLARRCACRSRCSRAGVITFVGTGVLGLSILPRYLTVPAVALCLFAGYALLGFTTLPHGAPARRRWARASAAAAVLGAVGLVVLAPSLTNVREELRFIRATHDSLVATARRPARCARGCAAAR